MAVFVNAKLEIAFLISGIWHGASWMFIFWGLLHGIGITINHYWKRTKRKMNKVLAWFITFNFVNITMIFFRAKEWDDAQKVLYGMFDTTNIVLDQKTYYLLGFLDKVGINFGDISGNLLNDNMIFLWLIIAFIIISLKNSLELVKYPNLLSIDSISEKKILFFASILFIALIVMSLQTYTEFIYFNF